MIISHKHRYIFIKTRKTAGTSIEIALSQTCGPEDIITPILPKDERLRQSMESCGPQNTRIPLRFYQASDWLKWIKTGRRVRFRNHNSARFIRDHIGEKIWSSYFKFGFERNPFEKAISLYFWRTRPPRPDMNNYIGSLPDKILSNWWLYTIDDNIGVDFVGRFEHLRRDLKEILNRLNLPSDLPLPFSKHKLRTNRQPYREILNATAQARIEQACAQEIAAFNYHWSENR